MINKENGSNTKSSYLKKIKSNEIFIINNICLSDAVEDDVIQTLCPNALQMVYSNITFTSHSGTTENCVTAEMDGCTNKTMLNFTQGDCTEKTLSGEILCLEQRLILVYFPKYY